MWWVGVSVVLIAVLVFFVYRKFTGPIYHIGSVRNHTLESPASFDDSSLLGETTGDTWLMPNNIKIHRMVSPDPPNPSATTQVVCVSGGPGIASAKPWALCSARMLQEHCTFHTFHPRGAGRSTKPFNSFPTKSFYPGFQILEATLGIQAQLSDLERMRRRLGVSRIALIGHSFGALLATLYAAEFGEHVSALVLLTPANFLCLPQDGPDFFSEIRTRLPAEDRNAFDEFKKTMLDFGSLPSETEETVQGRQRDFLYWYSRVEASAQRMQNKLRDEIGGWIAFATYLSLGRRFDLRSKLRESLSPADFRTVIINGSMDILPLDVGRSYASLFPQDKVEFKIIDSGHFLHEENAEELVELVRPTLLSAIP